MNEPVNSVNQLGMLAVKIYKVKFKIHYFPFNKYLLKFSSVLNISYRLLPISIYHVSFSSLLKNLNILLKGVGGVNLASKVPLMSVATKRIPDSNQLYHT